VSCVLCLVSCVLCLVSCVLCLVPCLEKYHRCKRLEGVPCVLSRVSEGLVSYVLCLMCCVLCLVSCDLCLVSCFTFIRICVSKDTQVAAETAG
jgi:hypothetical protein